MIQNIEKIENLLKIGKYDVMYRIEHNGKRLYVQEEPFKYYSGLTNALSSSEFVGDKSHYGLKTWRESFIETHGIKFTEDYVSMTADYGTLVHEAVLTIKNKGYLDWDNEEKPKAYKYFRKKIMDKGYVPDNNVLNLMVYQYQKEAASVMQFIHERVKEIYAIETVSKWDDLKIATPIDIFCLCSINGKYLKTTVNLKTSNNITQEHTRQVCCEFDMWNNTYPEEKAEATAILKTNNWTEGKTPTYKFKAYKPDYITPVVDQLKKQFLLCLENKDSTYWNDVITKSFYGRTKVGEAPNIKMQTLEQEWIEAREALSESVESNNN